MKSSWKIGAIIALVAVISLAAVGVSYAASGDTTSLCSFSWAYSNDDGNVGKPTGFTGGVDPDDNGQDPQAAQTAGTNCFRAAGDVASTTASFTAQSITFNLNNAYPGYSPTIFFGLGNQWATPGGVTSIDIQNPNSAVLTADLSGIALDQTINPGQTAAGALTIRVGDIPQNSQNEYSLSLKLTVSQQNLPGKALTLNNANLPNGQLGSSYVQTLTASNGNDPYTWSVTSSSLPPGLTLDPATGVISGVPTASGTFSFAITLADNAGDTVTRNLSITVPSPYVPANGYLPAAPAASTTTTPVATPPAGQTAELPPGGNTAEITPTPAPAVAPALPLISPVATTTPVVAPQAPVTTPQPTTTVAVVSQPVTQTTPGVGAPASVSWSLVVGLIIAGIVIILMIFWLIIVFFRRRKKKKDSDK